MEKPPWHQAMDEEFKVLINNKTWKLVLPNNNMNIIRTKWIFKIKRKADGSIERYKARLVAQWFKQHKDIVYELIYSPVMKSSTIRNVLSQAVNRGYKLRQTDVKNAFLQGQLDEVVHISATRVI